MLQACLIQAPRQPRARSGRDAGRVPRCGSVPNHDTPSKEAHPMKNLAVHTLLLAGALALPAAPALAAFHDDIDS